MTTRLQDVILRDTRANQPLATAVPNGTIYYVTDEGVTERSNASAWQDISDAGSGIPEAIIDAAGDLIYGSAADTAARLAIGAAFRRLAVNAGATAPEWVADTQNTVIDAAGDLLYGTAADTLARLAIGAANQVLRVNSGATAPEWAYPVIPQNSQSAAYTTVLSDAGKHILHPTADNNPRTFTIDSNANVAYPIGTAITFVNEINTVTIAITADTLTLAGSGTTGSRTLAAAGIATALKIATTSWIISGTGLT